MYLKLFGSPAFQFSYVTGFPDDIQKNLEKIQGYKDLQIRDHAAGETDLVKKLRNIISRQRKLFCQDKDDLKNIYLGHRYRMTLYASPPPPHGTYLPSSAWSVPLVQKCSWPIPKQERLKR